MKRLNDKSAWGRLLQQNNHHVTCEVKVIKLTIVVLYIGWRKQPKEQLLRRRSLWRSLWKNVLCSGKCWKLRTSNHLANTGVMTMMIRMIRSIPIIVKLDVKLPDINLLALFYFGLPATLYLNESYCSEGFTTAYKPKRFQISFKLVIVAVFIQSTWSIC